jgi:isopentenyl-diphosphate Delta-isomerase
VRRLREELGMRANLEFRFHARHRARLGMDLHENELVYVYFGRIEGRAVPNHAEASELDLLCLPRLRERCEAQPATFTVWLRHYLTHHYAELARAVRDL